MISRISIKSPKEIKIMIEGGRKLALIKEELKSKVKEGVSAFEVEELACRLIKKENGLPSFKMVPNYHWATCVNVNEGVVHGIPKKKIVFKKGDVVSVDVGFFYRGFHTDTSFSVALGGSEKIKKFLQTGILALKRSIAKAQPGARIYDLSFEIERTLKKEGYSPVRALVGHGIGRNLHEGPEIPGFVDKIRRQETPEILPGATLAIEVIYTMGSPDVKLSDDGWTILTSDGKISALFEDTVLVTEKGPLVLTEFETFSKKRILKKDFLGLKS